MNKDEISLTALIESEGYDVKRLGNYSMALCPFHPDNNPSLAIYDDNFFICFACQEKGDCIDYIMKLKDIGFKAACSYLGITGMISKAKKKVVKNLIQIIADEEKSGIDIKKRYGKEFIDILLSKELIRRSG